MIKGGVLRRTRSEAGVDSEEYLIGLAGEVFEHHQFFPDKSSNRFDPSSESFREAVRRLQLLYGLKIDGEFSLDVLRVLRMGRCWHLRFKDAASDLLGIASPSAGAWPRAKVKYHFGRKTSDFTKPFREVQKAIDKWNRLKKVKFERVDTIREADLGIGWSSPSSDSDGFGFPGDAIAHARDCSVKVTRNRVFVHFNDDLTWGAVANYVIEGVALHELGHILGLCDSNDKDSAMYHTFDLGESRSIELTDEDAYQQLFP